MKNVHIRRRPIFAGIEEMNKDSALTRVSVCSVPRAPTTQIVQCACLLHLLLRLLHKCEPDFNGQNITSGYNILKFCVDRDKMAKHPMRFKTSMKPLFKLGLN